MDEDQCASTTAGHEVRANDRLSGSRWRNEHPEVVPQQRVNRLLLDRTQVSLEASIERCPVRALVIDFQGYTEIGEQPL
jgi:hypothetical protein